MRLFEAILIVCRTTRFGRRRRGWTRPEVGESPAAHSPGAPVGASGARRRALADGSRVRRGDGILHCGDRSLRTRRPDPRARSPDRDGNHGLRASYAECSRRGVFSMSWAGLSAIHGLGRPCPSNSAELHGVPCKLPRKGLARVYSRARRDSLSCSIMGIFCGHFPSHSPHSMQASAFFPVTHWLVPISRYIFFAASSSPQIRA